MPQGFYMSSDIGKFVLQNSWGIPPLSASVNYGFALFEGASVIAKKTSGGNRLSFFHPMLNYERMKFGAEELGMDAQIYPMERHIKTVFQICALNEWHKKIEKDGKSFSRIYVRPLAYSKVNAIGLRVKQEFAIMHAMVPMGKYLNLKNEAGIKTILYPKPRNLPFYYIKTSGNYPISIRGNKLLNLFNEKHCEDAEETVFVNNAGKLTEGSGENILLLKDNELITPPVSAGALPGITLRIVAKIAESLGVKFSFRTFEPKDIEKAETMFFTGNAAGLVPIVSITEVDEKLSAGKIYETEIGGKGKLFKKINSLYENVVFGDNSFGDFSVYFDEWMGEKEVGALADEKRDVFSLSGKINPPEKWEKQKESVIKEFGIRKFL